MATFINPFTDFGFKRIFGQEKHKRILIGFLNALFADELVVTDLVYRDKEQTGETQQNRTVIYDIYCTLDDGSHVIVEMQNKKEVNMEQLTDIPWASQEELYAELSKVSHVAALSPQERAIYDEHLKQYRDNLAALEAARLDGIEEGKKAGIEEGIHARNREIVQKMLSAGLSVDFIAQMTGLTLADIEVLR